MKCRNLVNKKNMLFILFCVLAIGVFLTVSISAGRNQYGLEGDEVFSYISSTSMGGFKKICFLDDQTWYGADYFENALTAVGEERFNIGMVVENQAMDTHPPLYYIFLNAVCSSFGHNKPFSPWYGIGLNIAFMLAAGAGLYLLLHYFLHNRYLALFLSTVFCCSQVSMSMVTFARMYTLLMAFVVFQSWYHLKFYDWTLEQKDGLEIRKHIGKYLIVTGITILGALTHYYFLVYQCLIAMLYVFGLWLNKRYRDIFRYVGTMAAAGVAYVALYPAMLTHVFFKYRGREAVHKFLKEDTLFGPVLDMFSELNKQLFKGWLPFLLICLLFTTIVMVIRRKADGGLMLKRGILAAPALIYFFGISKASPFVSIKYISPVAPLIFAAVVVWGCYLIQHAAISTKWQKGCYAVAILAVFAVSFYFGQRPLKSSYFAERKEIVDELAKEADYCVYITGDEYNWKMWEDYVNYPQFQGLFFIDGRKLEPIRDERLQNQKKVVLYIDNALDLDKMYEYLSQYLPLRTYEVKYKAPYTYVILARE